MLRSYSARKYYIISTIVLFIICVLIVKLFSHQPIIRGFIGDVLVVGLIYSFVKIVFDFNTLKLSISVLLFAYLVEILQYFSIVDVLGLSENRLAKIVIGSTFDVIDLVAYTLGLVLVIMFERKIFFIIKLNYYEK